MAGGRRNPGENGRRSAGWRRHPPSSACCSSPRFCCFAATRPISPWPSSGLWLLALALILSQSWARQALDRPGLTWIGLSFAAVLAAGALSLTPYAIGGPHPVWTWVPGVLPTASIDPYLTLIELIKLIALAAVFLIGALVGSDDERAKSFIRRLLLFGLAYSLWAFADRVTNPTQLFGAPRPFDPNRLSASLVSANTAATFFGALTVLNLIDLDRQFRGRSPGGGRFDIRRLERVLSRIALPLGQPDRRRRLSDPDALPGWAGGDRRGPDHCAGRRGHCARASGVGIHSRHGDWPHPCRPSRSPSSPSIWAHCSIAPSMGWAMTPWRGAIFSPPTGQRSTRRPSPAMASARSSTSMR